MDLNPFELMKNLKNFQDEMANFKQKLSTITMTGSSGAGMVEVTINGNFLVTEVKIAPEAVDPNDKQTLEVLLASACNDATRKIQERIQEESKHYSDIFQGLQNLQG